MPYAQNYFALTTYCKLHFKVRGTNEIVFATPKLTGNAHWIRYSTTEITIVVYAQLHQRILSDKNICGGKIKRKCTRKI